MIKLVNNLQEINYLIKYASNKLENFIKKSGENYTLEQIVNILYTVPYNPNLLLFVEYIDYIPENFLLIELCRNVFNQNIAHFFIGYHTINGNLFEVSDKLRQIKDFLKNTYYINKFTFSTHRNIKAFERLLKTNLSYRIEVTC